MKDMLIKQTRLAHCLGKECMRRRWKSHQGDFREFLYGGSYWKTSISSLLPLCPSVIKQKDFKEQHSQTLYRVWGT